MILPPQESNTYPASAWTAGIAALFLVIGLSGAVTPLQPDRSAAVTSAAAGDLVALEEFEPPPAPEGGAPAAPPAEAPAVDDWEIPALPEVTPPLTPPEMAAITPLEPARDRPKPPPAVKPLSPKTRTPNPSPAAPSTSATAAAGNAAAKPGTGPPSAGTPGGTGQPAAQSGSGKGRFPQPVYPSAARRDRLQGTVRLAITVEPGGLPSTVSVAASSGHAVLDAAARDQVQRRWRWPAGAVRQFIIPIRFVLK